MKRRSQKNPKKRQIKPQTAPIRRVNGRVVVHKGVPEFDSKLAELAKYSLAKKDIKLQAALDAWRKLSRSEQFRTLEEIIQARGDELRRAYPDIIEIGHGYRTMTFKGARHVTREPCVTFMVKRKWKGRRDRMNSDSQRLPEFIYSFGSSRSKKRVLCGIPTNIESGHEYDIKPHNGQFVNVSQPGIITQRGAYCCAVKSLETGESFGLSCHHVLAMSTRTNPPGTAANGAVVTLERLGLPIGTLSQWMGRLVVPSLGGSFDAALSTITDGSALQTALGNTSYSAYWDRTYQIAPACFVKTPMFTYPANLVHVWQQFGSISYFPLPPQPIQPAVIEMVFTSQFMPGPGESGSPVIDRNGMLLGMYIAGANATPRGFMLPADLLFVGTNYGMNSDLDIQ